jgi:hypothetical protein
LNQLFLQFEGPATLLVQSRASRVRDILSDKEINEIADAPAGATFNAIRQRSGTTTQKSNEEYQRAAEEAVSEAPVPSRTVEDLTQEIKGISQNIATIRDGKVEFEKAGVQQSSDAKKQ